MPFRHRNILAIHLTIATTVLVNFHLGNHHLYIEMCCYKVLLVFHARGSVLLLSGYAADAVTHGIRPEDLLSPRRVSLVLRRVKAGSVLEMPSAQQVEAPRKSPTPYPQALLRVAYGAQVLR